MPLSDTIERPPVIPREAAETLVDALPGGSYTDNYQPYRNPLPEDSREELVDTVHELQNAEGVTNRENILALRDTLAGVATGEITDPIVIVGRCAEPVDPRVPAESLVTEALQTLGIAKRGLGRVIAILRSRGQNTKPRSSEFQLLAGGGQVTSYMGDMVNGEEEDDREPRPSRMIDAATQARQVDLGLSERLGRHVPAAHEALLLAYEQSFIRADSEGKLWSESGDLLWIGDRTRDPDGPHVEMLSKIENPVGVKLGPTTSPDDVKALYDRLNPSKRPGKVVFMIRTGLDNEELTAGLVDAIKEHAPGSVILYDIHGSTVVGKGGKKVRAVSRIIAEVEQLDRLCREGGLRLHGVHLETQPGSARQECVAEPDELPADKPLVDPLLNRPQTLQVYRALGALVSSQRTAA